MIFSKRLEDKLNDINTVLRKIYNKEEHVGVLEGMSGIALFQFYYAKYTNTDRFSDWGQDSLEQIINHINKGYNYPTYSSGIAGAGWVFDHLKNTNFIDLDCDDLLSPIDIYLYNTMLEDLKRGYYDYLHGAAGYAYYFFNRFQTTNNPKLKQQYQTYLEEFLKKLRKLASQDKNGIKWLSSINQFTDKRTDGYNLSLSHGISSIISILSELMKHKAFREKYKDLLFKSVTYLEKTVLQDVISTSLYPCWVLKSGEKDTNSRLAWCYGDLGVGLAFYKASKVLNDNRLKKKSLYILESTTKRRAQADTRVIDAGICHGAFGNAQIYTYLYKETHKQIYRDAATFWIDKGLQMSSYVDGYAGFKQWFGNPDAWKPKASLLEGIAGIGLSMIDYLSEEQNSWDKCLLIQ